MEAMDVREIDAGGDGDEDLGAVGEIDAVGGGLAARRWLHREDGSDGASDEEEEDEEEDYIDMVDEELWSEIKSDDPRVETVELSWEEGAEFVPNLNWEVEGKYFGANTNVTELTLEGFKDSMADEDRKKNMLHCVRGVAQNRSVKRLSLVNCDFSGDEGGWLTLLWPFFEHNGNFRELELWECIIHDTSVEMALEKINGKSLEYLRLEGNRMANKHTGEGIISRLTRFANLKLSLSEPGKGIGYRGYVALKDLLQDPQCGIKELSISGSGVSSRKLAQVAIGLAQTGDSGAQNDSVRVLNLRKNRTVSEKGWQCFFECGLPLSLHSLDLSFNYIDDVGIGGLGHALWCMRCSNSLRVLKVVGSHFVTERGWKDFLSILQRSSSALQCLHLGINRIGEEGLRVLGKLLGSSKSLTTLDLTDTGVTDESLVTLARGLVKGSTVDSLDLGVNRRITMGGWRNFFSEVFASPSSKPALAVKRIDLNSNTIDDDGIAELVSSLLGNASALSSLETLDLSYNYSVTPQGAQRLTRLLESRHCMLTELKVINIAMNDETIMAFAGALADNQRLCALFLTEHEVQWNEAMQRRSTVTARGWAALSNALCDRSSIDATYSSNHTLGKLCLFDDCEDDIFPDDLVSLLELNRGFRAEEVASRSAREVAREKILRYHMLYEQGTDIEAFVDMECNVMPQALAWAGKDDVGFAVLYQILRGTPSLFLVEEEGRNAGLKRKRAG